MIEWPGTSHLFELSGMEAGAGLFTPLAIALVFGHFTNPWAWIFIVTLFTFRQRDEDRHCAEKYGEEKWTEYKARVKYRIFPGVY